jgi:D-amino peptidase
MRIMIHTDLEGAAMVFTFAQCGVDAPVDPQARRFLTAEVNACVDGILDAAPDATVVVRDGHGAGGIDAASLSDRAELISGKGKGGLGLDASCAALFFVGQHAMAGTAGAHLPHTYSSREIEYYKLNGRPVGEFHMHAYLAGTVHGVPAAFLSGDEQAAAEARSLVPELVGVAVKEGLGREAARSLSAARARELIRAGAAEAVRRVKSGRIKPARIAPPYELEIRAMAGQEQVLEGFLRHGAERLDERTVVLRSDEPRAILRGNASVRLD